MNRYCYYCKIEKDNNEFSASKQKFHGGRNVGACKSCVKIKNSDYRKSNQEKLKEFNRKRRGNPERKEYDRQRSYQRRYGITREQYNQMRANQEYRCAICGIHEEEHRVSRWGHLCLDHDHSSGQLRGLLCAQCNKGLGSFNDTPDLLVLAADYLLFFRKNRSFEKVRGVTK